MALGPCVPQLFVDPAQHRDRIGHQLEEMCIDDLIVRHDPIGALGDHLLEKQLIRHLHDRAERKPFVAVAAHESQDGEQADQRGDEPARVAMRVDDARVWVLAEERSQRREMSGRLEQPPTRRRTVALAVAVAVAVAGIVLERLEHPAMQAVHTAEGVEVLELPARETRRVVLHAPVGAREVVHQEVHALTRQVARELVHRHEFGMDVGPELLFAFRQLAPALGVALVAQGMQCLPRDRGA